MARDKSTRVIFFLVNICDHHDVQESSKTWPFLVSPLCKREKNNTFGKLSSFYRAFLSKSTKKRSTANAAMSLPLRVLCFGCAALLQSHTQQQKLTLPFPVSRFFLIKKIIKKKEGSTFGIVSNDCWLLLEETQTMTNECRTW